MRVKNLCLFLITILIANITLQVVGQKYKIGWNETESISQKLFLIKNGKAAIDRGEYIVFQKGSKPPVSQSYIKVVAGIGGDIVTVHNDSYFINGKFIGVAKKYSKKGIHTKKSKAGIIPEGQFFVYAPHKDSLDSRYEEIGWISSSEIIGHAYPIF